MAARFPVRHYNSLDSTNSEATRLAAAGETGPVWIVAGEQTAGRGRNGRTWVSRQGSLYATLVYSTHLPEVRLADLGGAVALAVYDTVVQFVPESLVKLKWPNDCLVGGAKICGVLSEVCARHPLRVAIGCGINVAHVPEGLTCAASCIRHYDENAGCADVLDVLNERCAHHLAYAETENGRSIWQKWVKRSEPLGTWLSVANGKNVAEGAFAGLADDGALILEGHDGKRQTIYAGDVQIGDAS